jgi:hypothetical protein
MVQEKSRSTISQITCQEIAEWASAYLDEYVGEERKHQIAVHLTICAGCETYVKQIATVRDVVGLLPKTVEEPSDSHRLRQAFTARVRRSPSGVDNYNFAKAELESRPSSHTINSPGERSQELRRDDEEAD